MKWGFRDLVRSPIHFGLCLDEKKYLKEMARLGVSNPPPFLQSDHAHATAHFFTKKADGSRCVIVCMKPDANRDGVATAALLVHEAVHVWQEIKDLLGEDSPSIEFEAYSIQALSQELMDLYVALSK